MYLLLWNKLDPLRNILKDMSYQVPFDKSDDQN